jgi:hypothetical protein
MLYFWRAFVPQVKEVTVVFSHCHVKLETPWIGFAQVFPALIVNRHAFGMLFYVRVLVGKNGRWYRASRQASLWDLRRNEQKVKRCLSTRAVI